MQVGSTIGQYRLLRKIGEGGMGVVFVGEHLLIHRKAAIKLLKPEISSDRGALKRFFNEARATAAIQDLGIAQLFDVGLTRDKRAYIVMELLDGESLDVRLQRVGRLAPLDALRIARQVAGTLAVVHAAGIIHRDLKPGNLFSLVDASAPGGERIKILDFGVAKLGPDLHDGAQTRAGAIMGTPLYMSPEQCNGTEVDPRADIYSLGCVLFRLLTGQPPFELQGAGSVIAAHLTAPPPPPSQFVPDLAPGFDELVLRCLAKSRADRFPTMPDLAEECDRVLVRLTGHVGASLPRLPESTTVQLEWSSTLRSAMGEKPPSAVPRRRWFGAAAVLVVVAAIIIVAAISTRGRGGADDAGAVAPRPAKAAEPIAAEPAKPATAEPITAEPITAEPIAAEPITAEPTEPAATKAAAKPTAARSSGAKPASAPPATRPPVMGKPRGKPPTRDDVYEDRN